MPRAGHDVSASNERRDVRKLVLFALMLTFVLCASVAYSASSPSAKLKKQDRLYGGGQVGAGCYLPDFGVCLDAPRYYAVDGHAQGDGSEAVGNSNFGIPDVRDGRRSITCLAVEGNKAVIGGIIESGVFTGLWYAQFFVDNGAPGTGTRDQAGPTILDPPGAPGWPAGFPYTCPSPVIGWTGNAPTYRPVDQGDFVVQDSPSD
jgi:hypothetical protein